MMFILSDCTGKKPNNYRDNFDDDFIYRSSLSMLVSYNVKALPQKNLQADSMHHY